MEDQTQPDGRGDEITPALTILEAFKGMPLWQQKVQLADANSEYSNAKKYLQRVIAALDVADANRVAEQRREREAERQRKEDADRLRRAIGATIVTLEHMDRAQALSAGEARQIAANDRYVPELAEALGVPCAITTPDYAAAVAAWLRGEASALAATRAAERDAMGATK